MLRGRLSIGWYRFTFAAPEQAEIASGSRSRSLYRRRPQETDRPFHSFKELTALAFACQDLQVEGRAALPCILSPVAEPRSHRLARTSRPGRRRLEPDKCCHA